MEETPVITGCNHRSGYKENHKTQYVTPAKYKEEYPFLKEVDSRALANVQLHLNGAYRSFFDKKTGKPNFKSKKKSKASYQLTLSQRKNAFRLQ